MNRCGPYLLWLLFTFLLGTAVSWFRFDRQDLWIAQFTGGSADSRYYVSIIQHYRGEAAAFPPIAPFTYRPGALWLAAWLPFAPQTSLNVINVFALNMTAVFANALAQPYQPSQAERYGISAFLLLSFPAFYYTAIGYLDPVSVCLVTLGVYLITRRRWLPLVLLVLLGAFVKETIALVLPCYLAELSLTGPKRERQLRLLQVATLCAVYLVVSYWVRRVSIDPTPFYWTPNFAQVVRNLQRFRTYATVLFTLGPPLLIGWGLLRKLGGLGRAKLLLQRSGFRLALIGIGCSFALYIVALFGAHTDGRPLWYSYPFFILLFFELLRATGSGSAVMRGTS